MLIIRNLTLLLSIPSRNISFSSSYEPGLHLRLGMFAICCLERVAFQGDVKVAKLQQFHIAQVQQFKNM